MPVTWPGPLDRLFIGGEWVEPSDNAVIDIVSPVTEEVIASVPAASSADVDRAVAAARAAFDHGPWPRLPLSERIEVVRRLHTLLEERREIAAQLVTAEMGAPITQSRTIQVGVALGLIDAYAELAPTYPFRSVRRARSGNALVTRTPIGVVAAVVPWNMPLTIVMQKLMPSLLCGCTVVLKPAPQTPISAYFLAELFQAAGLPDGVVNVLPAEREASEYLISHPGIDKITFTGSTAAGRKIASICGTNLVPVTLELGGKSAAVILDDADLDATVESLRMGSLRNSGQVCSLKSRIIVSRRRHDEFVERLLALVRGMPVGDPLDDRTQIGPMVTAAQRATVERYIGIGRAEGARCLIGGGRPAGLERGWFVEPTVFSEVKPQMRIAQEEIFGPVLAVLTYDDEAEAVALANDSVYGINGSVFSGDLDRALHVAGRIRTGTVEINGNPVGFHAPIGGVKSSGLGREAGHEGFDAYVEIKSYGLPAQAVDSLA